jgi:hypothetical protein
MTTPSQGWAPEVLQWTRANIIRTSVEQRTSSLCPHVGPRQSRSMCFQHFDVLLISGLTVEAAKPTVARYKNSKPGHILTLHFHSSTYECFITNISIIKRIIVHSFFFSKNQERFALQKEARAIHLRSGLCDPVLTGSHAFVNEINVMKYKILNQQL